jgi:rhodanese-related sulfurtransferase
MVTVVLVVIGVFLLWDVAWWVMGVRPRFPWQLKARLGAGASDPVLLDLRTPREYNWFHLPGAINVPELLAETAKMPPVPPSREVVVICMTGHRSPLAAYALQKKGYTQVDHLIWGMVGWKVYEWVSRLRGRWEAPASRE